jgi:hypothetical protein
LSCCAGRCRPKRPRWPTYCLLLALLTLTWADTHETENESFWTRLNYGLVAVKEKKVCVVEGYWLHGIHLELPSPPPPRAPPGAVPTPHCNGTCMRMRTVVRATQLLMSTMKGSILDAANRINDLIPDIEWSPPGLRARTGRGLVDFIGTASSYLFGTATEGDIEQIKKSIKDVETMAETTAADASRVRQGLATFTKVQNERMDNFRRVLQEEQRGVTEVYRQLRAAAETDQVEFGAIAYATTELARFIVVHDDLQQLVLGVEDLVHGQLTPRLISVGVLRDALVNVTRALGRKFKHPCLTSPNELYTLGNYDFARRGRDLFIQLRIPYTNLTKQSIYRLHTLSLPVPGDQGLVSRLKGLPPYVIANRDGGRIGELQELPRFPVVAADQVLWHTDSNPSCLAALKADRPELVAKYCEFTVRKGTIEPTYVKLQDRKYVVSNLTQVHTACRGGSHKPLSVDPCMPCIVDLGCSCTLAAGEFSLEAEASACDNHTSSTEVSHAVNLAVLQAFYDLDNDTLTGGALLPPSKMRDIQGIKLPLFDTDRLLAADEAAGYSLRKMVDALQNESVILHTPAEAVIHDFMTRMTEISKFPGWTSWFTYVSVLPWVVIGLLAIVQIRTTMKLRALAAAFLATRMTKLPLVSGFAVRTEAPTPTTISPLAWIAIVAETHRHNLLIAAYLVILTLMLVGLALVVRKTFARRSYIYLDLATETEIAQLRFCALPDATRNFSVKVSKRPTILACRSFCLFGVISFQSKPWKLTYALTNRKVQLPTVVLIPFWKLKVVQRLISAKDCKVSPLIVHSHEYVYLDNAMLLRDKPDFSGQLV